MECSLSLESIGIEQELMGMQSEIHWLGIGTHGMHSEIHWQGDRNLNSWNAVMNP